MRRLETFAVGLLSSCALLHPAASQAHELPKGTGLVWQESAPADAEPIVITNRGLVAEVGDGFRIRCNEAYGVSTAVVPFLQIGSDGAWIIGTPEMVARSTDRACTLSPTLEQRISGTGLIGHTLQASTPLTLLVSVLDPDAVTEAQGSQLLHSSDEGMTWSQRLMNPEGELFVELVSAPSRTQRLYATGYRVDSDAGLARNLFARSDDGGASFIRHEIDARIDLLAVDPTNPDVVFATQNVEGSNELIELIRSGDAGETFSVVSGLQSTRITSFTATADGSSLWLGTDEGLFRSADHGISFVREHSDYSFVSCLAYRAGKLWMCAFKDLGVEGVWFKEDAAPTFSEFLTFDDVVKPMACEGDGADEVCRVPWHDWLIEIFPDGLRDAGMVEPDAGPDAGGVVDVDAGSETKAPSGGCTCTAVPKRAPSHWGLLPGALCVLWLLRRRGRSIQSSLSSRAGPGARGKRGTEYSIFVKRPRGPAALNED